MISPVISSGVVSAVSLSATLFPRRRTTMRSQNLEDVGHAVADQDDGHALRLHPSDEPQHFGHLADRDRRSRLVHQHELGVRQAGAGDCDGLALAARHLAHEVAGPGLGLQLLEDLGRAVDHRPLVEGAERAPPLLDLAAEEHVFGRGQVVGERKVLINDLDPLGARLDRAGEMHRLAFDHDLAGGGGKVAGDDLHQRRLAGAVVAHQPDSLAALDREVDAVQGMDGAEALGDGVEAQH